MGVDSGGLRHPEIRRLPFCGKLYGYHFPLRCVLRLLDSTCALRWTAGRLRGDYVIATVCNGKSYGGGCFAAPGGQRHRRPAGRGAGEKSRACGLPKVLGGLSARRAFARRPVREDLANHAVFPPRARCPSARPGHAPHCEHRRRMRARRRPAGRGCRLRAALCCPRRWRPAAQRAETAARTVSFLRQNGLPGFAPAGHFLFAKIFLFSLLIFCKMGYNMFSTRKSGVLKLRFQITIILGNAQ